MKYLKTFNQVNESVKTMISSVLLSLCLSLSSIYYKKLEEK